MITEIKSNSGVTDMSNVLDYSNARPPRHAAAVSGVIGCLDEGCDCWQRSTSSYRWESGDWVHQGSAP